LAPRDGEEAWTTEMATPSAQPSCQTASRGFQGTTHDPGASAGLSEEEPKCWEATHDSQHDGRLTCRRPSPGRRPPADSQHERHDGLPKPCTAEHVQRNSEGAVVEHANWMLTNRGRLVSIRQPLCGQQGEDRALSNRSVKLPLCIGQTSAMFWLKIHSFGENCFAW